MKFQPKHSCSACILSQGALFELFRLTNLVASQDSKENNTSQLFHEDKHHHSTQQFLLAAFVVPVLQGSIGTLLFVFVTGIEAGIVVEHQLICRHV